MTDLDASSGALGVKGGATLVLGPLLASPACRLRTLSACGLAKSAPRVLAQALSANASLTTLKLNSCLIGSVDGTRLAAALENHAALTALSLEHNPILDVGGVAVARLLRSTPLVSLSLRFTGVADRCCEALAAAMKVDGDGSTGGGDCHLRELHLAGNSITNAGAHSIAGALGAGCALHTLDMNANLKMDASATAALAKALPGSRLKVLKLAGCGVDKKACARLAAALLTCELGHLDLSANHFGNAGSDEFSWVLGECENLHTLNLSDCDLDDEAADELLDALSGEGDEGDEEGAKGARALRSLDLRWNKISAKHGGGKGISADTRVQAGSQKQKTAADRQTEYLEKTWQEAKAAGKKVYKPKWVREQEKMKKGATAGTGGAMA